jgi:acetyl esterase/lipase
MDVTSLLDPDIAALLAAGPLLGPLSLDTLPASRANMRALADAYVETGAVERTDHVLTSPDGHQFAVRVHRPKGVTEPLPAIVWMHGGGLVSGTHLVDDGRFDRWCPKFGGVVGVSVDYGLAPERPYPGPVEDCYTALRWTHDHADELGIVPGRVGIGGASAGGNQAAGLALLARDRGELAVELQALIYPMLDDRMITASSSWDVPIWPPASNDFGWSAYLQGRRGADDIPAYAAPARADDVAGLPPTFICVGALDGFLDEDVEYASRLARAGVPVELHIYPGAPHGFDLMMVNTEVARRCRRHLDEWLEARLTG